MKVSWDKLCRAAFAAAAACTLWVSSSIASACPADAAPDREGDRGDDGILGEGAADNSITLDTASDAVGPAGSGAVADYLQNLVATWEDISGQPLSVGVDAGDLTVAPAAEAPAPAESLTAKDCAESVNEQVGEPQDAIAEADEVDAVADVEPPAVVGEASDLAEAIDPVADGAEPVVAESVDADVIVGDAVAEVSDLAGDWTLPAQAQSFAFDEAQQPVTEEAAVDEVSPVEEAAPAELPSLPAATATPEQAVVAESAEESVVPATLTAEGDGIDAAVAEIDAADLDRSSAEPLATNEDTAVSTDEPEAAPAGTPEAPAAVQSESATPTGPEESAGAAPATDLRQSAARLAASAWFQTMLERYHAQPLEASAVRPLYCGLTELTNWRGAADQLADAARRQRDVAPEGEAVVASGRTDEASEVAPATAEAGVATDAEEVLGY